MFKDEVLWKHICILFKVHYKKEVAALNILVQSTFNVYVISTYTLN